jgi:hypothetical protein
VAIARFRPVVIAKDIGTKPDRAMTIAAEDYFVFARLFNTTVIPGAD